MNDEQPIRRDLRTCTQRQDEAIAALRARVAALEAAQNITIMGVRDAETGEIHWTQPTATVPILGSVAWDTGAIRWTRGATPAGWRKVWTPETHGTEAVTP